MSLTLTNESKYPNASPYAPWSERALTWRETGPAHDTWQYPGVAITKESKSSLSITNEAKIGGGLPTWDEYTISYDDSLPDTWDTVRNGFFITNETKN